LSQCQGSGCRIARHDILAAYEHKIHKQQHYRQRQFDWQAHEHECSTREITCHNRDLQDQLHNKQKAIEELESKLVQLKKSISASGRIEDQVSDEILIARITALYNDIQNMVVNAARGHKLSKLKRSQKVNCQLMCGIDRNPHNMSHETRDILRHTLPSYTDLETSNKVHICQAIVAFLLNGFFTAECLIGVPEHHRFAHAGSLATSLQDGEHETSEL